MEGVASFNLFLVVFVKIGAFVGVAFPEVFESENNIKSFDIILDAGGHIVVAVELVAHPKVRIRRL